jgi:hypothetical protein
VVLMIGSMQRLTTLDGRDRRTDRPLGEPWHIGERPPILGVKPDPTPPVPHRSLDMHVITAALSCARDRHA